MNMKNKQPWSNIGAGYRQESSYLSRQLFLYNTSNLLTCTSADKKRKAYPFVTAALQGLSFKTKVFGVISYTTIGRQGIAKSFRVISEDRI